MRFIAETSLAIAARETERQLQDMLTEDELTAAGITLVFDNLLARLEISPAQAVPMIRCQTWPPPVEAVRDDG